MVAGIEKFKFLNQSNAGRCPREFFILLRDNPTDTILTWDGLRTALKFGIFIFRLILYIFGPPKNHGSIHGTEPI